MSRNRKFSLIAIVVGTTFATAYAFARGPFSLQSRSTPYAPISAANATCPTGTCPDGTCQNGRCPLVPLTPGVPPSVSAPPTSVPAPVTAVPPTTSPVYPASATIAPSVTYRPAPVVPAVAPRKVTPAVDKPIGHWRRSMGSMTVEWQGKDGLLNGSVTIPADETTTLRVDFVVEYSVTRDGLLYGVVQSADIETPNVPAGTDVDDLLEAKFMATKLIDRPIAMRCRVDDGTLTVKSFDLALPMELIADGGIDAEMITMLQATFIGRYPAAQQYETSY